MKTTKNVSNPPPPPPPHIKEMKRDLKWYAKKKSGKPTKI